MKSIEYTLKVRDFTILDIAVSSDEGDKINAAITDAFEKNVDILILDFDEIKVLNTAFLNAAIGQLYAVYNSEFLNKHLKIINIKENDLVYLKKAISTAKEYFSNPDLFDESAKSVFE